MSGNSSAKGDREADAQNEDGEGKLNLEPSPAEIEAGRLAMGLRMWSLNQAIGWIATRRPEAVGCAHGAIGLSVWMVIEKLSGRPAEFPFQSYDAAWHDLRAVLAIGSLRGIGTHVRMRRDAGSTFHSVGVPFPPDGQPGFAMGCEVFEGSRAIVSPPQRNWEQAWDEFHEVSFRREDVMREFPAGVLTIKGDAERRLEPETNTNQLVAISAGMLPLSIEKSDERPPGPALSTTDRVEVEEEKRWQEKFGPPKPTARELCEAFLEQWHKAGQPAQSRPQERTLLARVKSIRPDISRAIFRGEWTKARQSYPDVDWSVAGRRRLR